MDTRSVERKGINGVSDALCDCGYIEDHLTFNDKTLLWDGDLYVFSSPDMFVVDNYRYSVKAQVKATDWRGAKIPQSLHYAVKLRDLRKYLSDGGVVFFRCLVARHRPTKVYYAVLSKTVLEKALELAPGEKTRNIELFPLKDDSEFLAELEQLHQQASHNIVRTSELEHRRHILRVRVPEERKGKHPLSLLAGRSRSILAEVEGFSALFYLDAEELRLHSDVPREVRVQGKTYYSHVRVEYEPDGLNVHVGSSLNVHLPQVVDKGAKAAEYEAMLSYGFGAHCAADAECDLCFLIAAFSAGNFTIGEMSVETSVGCGDDRAKQLSAWRGMLDFVQRTRRLYAALGISEDIDFNTLTETEAEGLELLMSAVLDDRQVRLEAAYDPCCDHLEQLAVGATTIVVCMKRQKDGSYRMQAPYM